MRGVLVYAFEGTQGQRESASSVNAGDDGGAARLGRVEKGFDLCTQRLNIFYVKMVNMDAGRCASLAQVGEAADRGVTSSVVHGDIIMRLKETHLANLFRADTRGSDIGDRAGSEFKPRIGRIHTARQHGNADGPHIRHFHLASDKPLHYVQIVNHQIQHDIYIERARGKLADAVYLEIERPSYVRAQRCQRRVEAFEMPDLQERARTLCGCDHPVRLFKR